MKKKSLLLAIAAMSMAAVGVGTVGTFAWYTASNNATVQALEGNSGTLTSGSTTINANNFKVEFTFAALSDETPELAHLGSGDYVNGNSGATYTSGTLYKGVYNSTTSLAVVQALTSDTVGDCVQAIPTLTAAWKDGNPTDASDIAYLANKTFDVTVNATGQAKFLQSTTAFSGISGNGTSITLTCTISADAQSINVEAWSVDGWIAVYLEPANLNGGESSTTGSIQVVAQNSVTFN